MGAGGVPSVGVQEVRERGNSLGLKQGWAKTGAALVTK